MISGRVSDLHLRIYTQRNPDAAPNPERRLRLQIPGIVLSSTGVLLFGWFCDFRIHVVSVIIANSLGNFTFQIIFVPVLNPPGFHSPSFALVIFCLILFSVSPNPSILRPANSPHPSSTQPYTFPIYLPFPPPTPFIHPLTSLPKPISRIRHDLGIHHHHRLPDRKHPEQPRHARRPRRSVPKPRRRHRRRHRPTLGRRSGPRTKRNWQNKKRNRPHGPRVVLHRSRPPGTGMCRVESVAHAQESKSQV